MADGEGLKAWLILGLILCVIAFISAFIYATYGQIADGKNEWSSLVIWPLGTAGSYIAISVILIILGGIGGGL